MPAQTPSELRADVEANLAALGIDHLTAVNLRRMDEHEAAGDVAFDDQLAEMVKLRDEGKIAGVGVGVVSASLVDQAIKPAGIVCVQNAFSLVDQGDAAVLDRCTQAGIADVPYFPLGPAFPHLPKVTEQPAVRAVATRQGVPAARVGLAWLFARADNALLIPGTSSVVHFEENMGRR